MLDGATMLFVMSYRQQSWLMTTCAISMAYLFQKGSYLFPNHLTRLGNALENVLTVYTCVTTLIQNVRSCMIQMTKSPRPTTQWLANKHSFGQVGTRESCVLCLTSTSFSFYIDWYNTGTDTQKYVMKTGKYQSSPRNKHLLVVQNYCCSSIL